MEPIKVKSWSGHLLKHPKFTGCIMDSENDIAWYQNGKVHREDGPALEYATGYKAWYKDGKCHREDGPAYEFNNGTKYWYKNGLKHREDGPAVEFANGYKEWFLNNKDYTEEEYKLAVRKMKIDKVLKQLDHK